MDFLVADGCGSFVRHWIMHTSERGPGFAGLGWNPVAI